MSKKVLYHANCNDGFCAAFVLWKYYFENEEVEYIPVKYGQLLGELADEMWIVDFCYPINDLRRLSDRCSRLTIIDHHKSAREAIDKLPKMDHVEIVFDVNHSGGRLTFDWVVREKTKVRESLIAIDPPWIVDYTEDRDMWWHKLPMTHEINAGLNLYERTFEQWDCFILKSELALEGSVVLRYQKQLIDQAVRVAKQVVIQGHKVYCVNSTVLFSEIAGALAEKGDFGACWFRREDGKYQYSLRSRGDFDVSEIARTFGGGGHRNAAGFEIEYLI